MTNILPARVEYDADRGAMVLPLYSEYGDNGEFFGVIATALLGRSSQPTQVVVEVQERTSDGQTVTHRVESNGPWWSVNSDTEPASRREA